MPPAIFQLVALLIAFFSLASAIFPRQMSQWRMRGPGGRTEIEPGPMRVLMMRIVGVVVAALALLMAFGDASILL